MNSLIYFAPIAIMASFLTYTLRHKYHWNAIRASTLPTLIFSLLTSYLNLPNPYQALFFGATFVGMSTDKRLGKLEVIFSSLIYVLIYSTLVDLIKGPGGVLGTLAFISSSAMWLIKKNILRIRSGHS